MIHFAFAPWEWLLTGLGTLLAFFYDIIPEYGIAIILLTLTVSLVLFPLTVKQTRSMKAMQEIQPEVKKLQKELKGDKEELNKQLMELTRGADTILTEGDARKKGAKAKAAPAPAQPAPEPFMGDDFSRRH